MAVVVASGIPGSLQRQDVDGPCARLEGRLQGHVLGQTSIDVDMVAEAVGRVDQRQGAARKECIQHRSGGEDLFGAALEGRGDDPQRDGCRLDRSVELRHREAQLRPRLAGAPVQTRGREVLGAGVVRPSFASGRHDAQGRGCLLDQPERDLPLQHPAQRRR